MPASLAVIRDVPNNSVHIGLGNIDLSCLSVKIHLETADQSLESTVSYSICIEFVYFVRVECKSGHELILPQAGFVPDPLRPTVEARLANPLRIRQPREAPARIRVEGR